MSLPLVCKVLKQADCLIHVSFIVLRTELWSYFRAWIDVVNSPTMLFYRGFFSTTVRNRILCASEAQLLALLNKLKAQSILHFLFFIEFNCNHVKKKCSLFESFFQQITFEKWLHTRNYARNMPSRSPPKTARLKKKNNKKETHKKAKCDHYYTLWNSIILRLVLGFMGQNRGMSLLQGGGCIIWGLDQVRPSNKDEVCSESWIRQNGGNTQKKQIKNTRIWKNVNDLGTGHRS